MKTIRCLSCGDKVNAFAPNCPNCGASLKMARKMVNCRVCGEFVAKNAQRCPHCGARTPNMENFVMQIVASCILVVIFVPFILSIGRSDTDTGEKPAKEYIEITAVDLWVAYQENAVKADLLYGDKLLAVTGVVTDIGQDMITSAPCVSLDNGNTLGLHPIKCFFPKNGEQTELLASLLNGDTVTIFGTCTGEFVTTVQLSKCHIEGRS